MPDLPSQHIPRLPPPERKANAPSTISPADDVVLIAFKAVMGRPPASSDELDRYRRYLLGYVVAAETIARNASSGASAPLRSTDSR